MKKILLITAVCFSFITRNTAQDLLIKNNGDTIKAKILEINEDAIRYKRTNNLDGPTFVTNKSELARLIYANGTEEKIEVKATTPSTQSDSPAKSSEPNIDTRSDDKKPAKSSSTEFEKIAIEPFGFYYKGIRMSDNRLLYLYRSFGDPALISEFKSAKTNSTASLVTGFVGIPLAVGGVMFTIISFVPTYDEDGYKVYRNKNLLGPGIGLFAGFIALEATSIVLKSIYKSKLKKTVNHYNSIIAKHDLK